MKVSLFLKDLEAFYQAFGEGEVTICGSEFYILTTEREVPVKVSYPTLTYGR